ncbi:PAS domain-containing hybrid sensor histidine kinase/response regulator [Legionella shakespearei]|uniref:histidine kinase n=1 Tax=Legionella shakespearei DSM 23087 TaxID=1122169 RepID=A0A0W0YI30_9GAMM|nr:PAS domain-containing hybrid sensor histidine kinase/response regulator [Legionella shakespearei]KTD56214.1 sensory histidine-kinase / response regulator [Legionella shakespearei DSM 23087]
MGKDKHIQSYLKEVGLFLSKLAEKSDNVYWLSSPDFKTIQYISPAYEKIWGRSRQELYDTPEIWVSFLHPEDALKGHPIQEMAARVARLGSAARLSEHYRIVRPDGEIRWIMDNGFPIYDNKGNCCGVTGVAVDITKEKLYESQLEKAKEEAETASKAKSEFLENMRHDIRTPLTGIVGFADMIKMESQELRIKEYAENLIASSHALLDLLDEVLDSIRVSSGDIPNLKKKFNLQKTMRHVIDLNRAKAAERKLALELYVDPAIPQFLVGDKIRLHRIALELVANALNFTEHGSVKLSLLLAKKEGRELVINLIVEDTGIGIPKEKQQEIYIQFKRLTPSYQGIYRGTGLGLSVVKQFVNDLGGEIYVESERKKGTRFTCSIPLNEALLNNDFGVDEEMNEITKASHKTKAIPPKSTEISANELMQKQYTVLIVEDNLIAQSVAKSILNKLNCRADIADTGKKAVELCRTNHYDLIFMDIGLPDIDGYEVTHMIRVQELDTKIHTPIVALTAHGEEDDKTRCINAGMNAVLIKPLTAKACDEILDAFLAGYNRDNQDN